MLIRRIARISRRTLLRVEALDSRLLPAGIVALDDFVDTPRGVSVDIDVLHNDRGEGLYSPIDGVGSVISRSVTVDRDSVEIVQAPSRGTAHVREQRGGYDHIVYQPDTSGPGFDTLIYRVRDSLGRYSDTATVTITVGDGLVANNDHYTFPGGKSYDIVLLDVLANDHKIPHSDVTIIDPGLGSLTPHSDRIRYTLGAPGSHITFPYTVRDTFGNTSTALVTVVVTIGCPTPCIEVIPPEPKDDTFTTHRSVPVTIDVLANDVSKTADSALSIVSINEHEWSGTPISTRHGGRVEPGTHGHLVYVPPTDFIGQDDFTYRIRDISNTISVPATAVINIEGAEHIPTALHETGDEFELKMVDWNNDGFLDLVAIKKRNTGSGHTELHVLSGATRFQTFLLQTPTWFPETGDEWEFDVVDWDADGLWDLIGYRKYGNPSGKIDFAVTTARANWQQWVGGGDTWFTANPDLSATTFEFADWGLDRGLPGNDILMIFKEGTGSGTTEVHAVSGTSAFMVPVLHTATSLPLTGDSATFEVRDWNGDGALDLVLLLKNNTGTRSTEIHVLDGSDFHRYLLHDGSVLPETDDNYVVTTGDWNRDGRLEVIGIQKRQTPSGRTEVIVASTFAAEELLSEGLRDAAPKAAPDSAKTASGIPVRIDVLANDRDPDGDALMVTSVSQPTFGIVSILADGAIWYEPPAQSVGVVEFTYEIVDEAGERSEGAVTVDVTNSAPAVESDVLHTPYGTEIHFSPLANDYDPDGNSLTLTSVGTPRHGQVVREADSELIYLPSPGFFGVDTFEYTVDDGYGGTTLGEILIDVAPEVQELPGDCDADGDVDTNDLAVLITHWTGALESGIGGKLREEGDIDNDQDVDSADLNWLIIAWTGALAGRRGELEMVSNANIADAESYSGSSMEALGRKDNRRFLGEAADDGGKELQINYAAHFVAAKRTSKAKPPEPNEPPAESGGHRSEIAVVENWPLRVDTVFSLRRVDHRFGLQRKE